MDNTQTKTRSDKSESKRFCNRMQRTVDTNQTLQECIGANECFSDDPCPLSGQFKVAANLNQNHNGHRAKH